MITVRMLNSLELQTIVEHHQITLGINIYAGRPRRVPSTPSDIPVRGITLEILYREGVHVMQQHVRLYWGLMAAVERRNEKGVIVVEMEKHLIRD
jgi:hypothetical protein